MISVLFFSSICSKAEIGRLVLYEYLTMHNLDISIFVFAWIGLIQIGLDAPVHSFDGQEGSVKNQVISLILAVQTVMRS